MERRSLTAIVLAAGGADRMRSDQPRALHPLCGRPMLLYVLDALLSLRPRSAVVVVGGASEDVTKRLTEELAEHVVDVVEQRRSLGTGHDAALGLASLGDDDELAEGDVVVAAGHMPLLPAATLSELVNAHRRSDRAATVLTAAAAPGDPRPRARRAAHGDIVELVRPDAHRGEPSGAQPAGGHEETTPDVAAAPVFCVRRSLLGPALRRLRPDPADGRYRLSDLVAVLDRAGYRIGSVEVDDPAYATEVDDRATMADAERAIRLRINRAWLAAGVTMVDPATAYLDATVRLGRDVTVWPNTLLQGRTVVGNGAELGPDTHLVDCMVGEGARVTKSVGRDAEIGPGADIGPFVVVEPGAQVPSGAATAPFTAIGET